MQAATGWVSIIVVKRQRQGPNNSKSTAPVAVPQGFHKKQPEERKQDWELVGVRGKETKSNFCSIMQ